METICDKELLSFIPSSGAQNGILNPYHLVFISKQERIQWPGRGGAEKHEIYAAAFGGHLFYDLLLQGGVGWHGPSPPDTLLQRL